MNKILSKVVSVLFPRTVSKLRAWAVRQPSLPDGLEEVCDFNKEVMDHIWRSVDGPRDLKHNLQHMVSPHGSRMAVQYSHTLTATERAWLKNKWEELLPTLPGLFAQWEEESHRKMVSPEKEAAILAARERAARNPYRVYGPVYPEIDGYTSGDHRQFMGLIHELEKKVTAFDFERDVESRPY